MVVKPIDILTIMLSWNRPKLLEKSIHSYFRTVSVSHNFYVVDNASNRQTVLLLKRLAKKYKFKVFYLNKNMGGRAFNIVLNHVDINNYRYFHFSENDLEYRPGWDKKLLKKMGVFQNVGQLSLYSLEPEIEKGEIWASRPGVKLQRKNQVVFISPKNIGTTCIVRKELIKRGLRWKNVEKGKWRFPADSLFSMGVKKMGYKVAWNDRYLATNWGHNIEEYQKEVDYYISNYTTKRIQLNGFINRLLEHGYQLVRREDGTFHIQRTNKEQ
ncbi:glycosyltransferase family 2 protein [Halalkalibacter lacteus]|uniref:glycosyltransferase family 2 protein n=1 Tax=Halalkalibacter lacteus TaxID=3090663 RepID=UPI002FCC3AD3